METKQNTVLIVGGGFAGISLARKLSKKLPRDAKVVLISNKSYFEYYPALYRVVTGASPIEVCIPLNYMLDKNIEIVLDTVINVDLNRKEVTTVKGDVYSAEKIVLALGSETTYYSLPGVATLSLGFKSVKEALTLKNHLYSLFDGHFHPSQNELVSHFHVVIIGGGPTGVEVAGDLSVYLRKLAKEFHIDPSLVTIDLIQAAPRLIPQLPEIVSRRVERQLRLLGVNIFLNRQLVSGGVEQIYLKDMSMKADTVIWTAGTQINKLYGQINGLQFSDKKRVIVDEYLSIPGYRDIYVIGDAADTKYTGLAQTANYDGGFVAKNIIRLLTGKTQNKYIPKKNAFAIPVGDNWGVFVWNDLHVFGPLAYLIRHAIDFIYFSEILHFTKFFSLFFEGFKYRMLKAHKAKLD